MLKHIILLFWLLPGFMLHGAEITPKSLNQTLGIPLFANQDTWSKKALEKRLKIRFTGNAKRYSAKFSRMIAGARPVELEVHTAEDEDTISMIIVTFANQGDTVNKHKSVIKNSGRTITAVMTRGCGKKRHGKLSDGTFRVTGDMWQTRYANFLLEVDKGDFVMFYITPSGGLKEAADHRDKDFSKNVKRNKFGDVFIPTVPMVDQGSKGYCVPATMTRIFLYFGIHTDMHHVAKLSDTDRDKGTSVNTMLKEINQLRKKNHLKIKRFSEVSVKNVSRHIDNGLPVVWLMYSTGDLQAVYKFSTLNRGKASSPEQWKRTLKKVSVSNSTDGSHALLIIGYNKQTDEIAVSNSWGQAHIAPLWIPMKVAKKVSQKYLFVFEP